VYVADSDSSSSSDSESDDEARPEDLSKVWFNNLVKDLFICLLFFML
jgi:hypothetical protein